MTPYGDFTFFGILLLALIPAIVLGLLGRPLRALFLAVTVAIITLVIYTDRNLRSVPRYWFVMAFFIGEWVVLQGYLRLRVRWHSVWLYRLALCFSVLPLILVKAWPLVRHSVIGFLGISYLTFRCVQVIIDTRDGLVKQVHLSEYAAFVLAFPTLSSGPIDRYRRFVAEWHKPGDPGEYVDYLTKGLHHLFRGFLYKFVLAVVVKERWLDPVGSVTPTALAQLSYMYAYSAYLFFDFAGYSAFAIGVSQIFRITPPHNFRAPFLSSSIADFWNRWHISLSSWFRDYVYMRFVVGAIRSNRFSSKYTASYFGLLLTFGLMGIWHGTELHYILYGLYHASLLIGFDLFGRLNNRYHLWGNGPIWHALSVFMTFQAVCFGFLIFSGHLITA